MPLLSRIAELMMLWFYRLLQVPPGIALLFALAMVLVIWARRHFDAACACGADMPLTRWVTGAEAAREILLATGFDNVLVERVRGAFADYYDPDVRTIRLSEVVYEATSITAASLAMLEVGHALQDARRDAPAPLGVRDAIAIICKLGTLTCALMGSLGLFLDMPVFLNAGLGMFGLLALTPMIGFRIEYNADHRARRALAMSALVASAQEDLATRILDAARWRSVSELLPRLRAAAWRRMRPNPPGPKAPATV
jgi:Zn-dependent membrane protease YugP